MDFDDLLSQVLDLLQRDPRVSYRALKRRFGFDDGYIGKPGRDKRPDV
jgi:hypothetical protein